MTRQRYLRAAPHLKKALLQQQHHQLPTRPSSRAYDHLLEIIGSIAFGDSMETFTLMVAGSADMLVNSTPRSMWWHQ